MKKYTLRLKDGRTFIPHHQKVKVKRLKSTRGFLVKKEHLSARRKGATGILGNPVPGYGGDVWWVLHEDDGKIAAYAYGELEIIQTSTTSLGPVKY